MEGMDRRELCLQKIINSEIRTLKGMEEILRGTIDEQIRILNDSDYLGDEEIKNLIFSIKKLISSFAEKENSIAEIIKSITKLQAAFMNINPCSLNCNSEKVMFKNKMEK
ncbi:hypothetical protein ACOAKC_03690 [Hathewaya histolytica]|uniref:hypothetical protein n=1 Tax=Hathewaya histolytica TaxID=1498 RepID=UPI003B676360